ncbi:MAG: ABC transporter substrate-binding protein [Nitrospirota bacterium]
MMNKSIYQNERREGAGHTIPRPLCLIAAVFLCAGLLCSASLSAAGSLTPQEKRGRHIYIRTESPSGEKIRAYIGKDLMEAPGSAMPCAGCHGMDGLGRPESGVIPTNVTWEHMTKPYGVRHESGRTHPPYTGETLARSIAEGIDPAGNRLDPSMPLYLLSKQDMADLVAYMKRLGSLSDPGVSPSGIRIGTLLPSHGQLTGAGAAMRAAVEAYFMEINQQGGLYNRRLELVAAEYGAGATAPVVKARTMIEEGDVFALAAGLFAGAEGEVAALVEAEGVPFIGPLTLFPQDPHTLNNATFYVFSGLGDQARALVDYATQRQKRPAMAVVYDSTGTRHGIIEAAREQLRKHGLAAVSVIGFGGGRPDAARTVRELQQAGVDSLLFFGSPEALKSVLAEADRVQWQPLVLLAGAQSAKELFAMPLSFHEKIVLSSPTAPSDLHGPGAVEFALLAEKYRLSPDHKAAQISAYAAARILVEGLKSGGRELTREKLVKALEGLYRFETGVTPRISYAPNRRTGALGAHIITVDLVDKTFRPAGDWITPR